MTPEKKKPWSSQVQEQSNAYADTLQNNANQLADVTSAAGQAQLDNMVAAQDAQQKANQTALELYQQRMNEGYTSFADIIGANERRMQQEQEEAERRIAEDKKKAKWTAVTELASSIANLAAVGGHNAVNQQYKSFSQDWMRKADQDMREHRMRMDNLRSRQDALRQQLAQMKMGDAGQALANAQKDAERAYQNALQRETLRYNNTINPAQIRAQGAEKAEAARLQGTQSAANLGMSEASLAQRQAEHAATMASKGFNPDGSVNEEYMKKVAAATRKGGGSGSSGTPMDFVIDGKHYTVNMSKEAYDTGIRRGREAIRKDVMARAGFNGSWSEFEKLAGGGLTGKERKAAKRSGDLDKYSEYADIVSALSGYGEIDPNNEAIKDYIEDNNSSMQNLNRTLMAVAGNATENGIVDEAPAAPAPQMSISDELSIGTQHTPAQTQAKAQAPAKSIEDDLWGQADTQTEAQSAPANMSDVQAEAKPEVQPEVQPGAPKKATDRADVPNPYWDKKWSNEPIDNQRFKTAYNDALKGLLNRAAKNYAEKTGEKVPYYDKQDTLNQAVSVLRRHQSDKGLDNWDDAMSSIVKGSDIAQYISSEDRDLLRQMMKDKETMTAYDFANKYNIQLQAPSGVTR